MESISNTKWARGIKALGFSLRSPSLLKEPLIESLKSIYRKGKLAQAALEIKALEDLFDVEQEIRIEKLSLTDGNVSPYELMAIASIVARRSPKTLVEIGTFDGMTTLQMALNAPQDAVVHTLDLPKDLENGLEHLSKRDLAFAKDQKKWSRKYVGSSSESKIVQHLGDSMSFDFSRFTAQGPVDLAFIDGGHSYSAIKNDTEKMLSVLASNGLIIWHDFDPNWPEVYRYLSELSRRLHLIQIARTSLVIMRPR